MTTTPLPEPVACIKGEVLDSVDSEGIHAYLFKGTKPFSDYVYLHTAEQLRTYTAAECAARDALNIKAHGEIRDLNAALAKRDDEIEHLHKVVGQHSDDARKWFSKHSTLRTAAQQALEALQHAMTENFRHQLAQQKIYNAKELADAITALTAALESKA